MKNNKYLKMKNLVIGLPLLLLSLTGCDSKWIDSNLNVDPDSPSDVPMGLILPAVQQSMGYVLEGNDNVRTDNIWTQHFDGVSRQSYTEARYQLLPADVNNLWSTTYTSIFMNLDELVRKSKEDGKESPHFRGVGEVLQATSLQVTTDLFGDIPYSNALGGNGGNLRPEYDSQQKIYDTIFNLLDKAVVDLNSTENVIDVSGDVMYDADLSKWVKAANSIKAKAYLQLSNQLGDEAYTKALAAAKDGFTSNDDDFKVPFSDKNRNPIFQFMEQRGDIRMGSTFVDMLTETDDPRLPEYVAENANGEYVGSVPGSENADASEPGPYAASPTSTVYFMTYSQLKFIEAEAQFKLEHTDLAQTAYEKAVAASVLRVTGEANTEWLDANINGKPVTFEDIMKQKYIDGFATNQPYADYRRTGLPDLQLAEGALTPTIPTRFPYPQSEYDYNQEHVPSNDQLTDKVWWDQ